MKKSNKKIVYRFPTLLFFYYAHVGGKMKTSNQTSPTLGGYYKQILKILTPKEEREDEIETLVLIVLVWFLMFLLFVFLLWMLRGVLLVVLLDPILPIFPSLIGLVDVLKGRFDFSFV